MYLYDPFRDRIDERLLENSRDPEYEVCRVLASRGLRGKLAVWEKDPLRIVWVTEDIEAASKLSVTEGRKTSLRVVPHKPPPMGSKRPPCTHPGNEDEEEN